MSTQEEKDRKLYSEILNILVNDWDPIGLRGLDEAPGEYDRYAPEVYAKVKKGRSAEQIAEFLLHVERTGMSNTGDKDRALRVAEKVLALYR